MLLLGVTMVTFSTVPMDEARRAVRPPRRATQEQYRTYIRQRSPDVAGKIELGGGDRSITERARLKAAAKAEGSDLDMRRRGNVSVFWQTTQPPKPRSGQPPAGRGRGRQRGR